MGATEEEGKKKPPNQGRRANNPTFSGEKENKDTTNVQNRQ